MDGLRDYCFVEKFRDFVCEEVALFLCMERLSDFFTHSLRLHYLFFWRLHDLFCGEVV